VTDILGAVARILTVARSVDRRLEGLVAPALASSRLDVAAQRDALVYDGFVSAVGPARLADVARYLQGMVVRLDKLPDAVARDRRHLGAVHRVQARYHDLLDTFPATSAPPPEVVDIAWMIEELRVNLFAQSLGTSRPVSEERILRAIDAARG
jgi:ATP-dependent helicase HrpA